ncbi:MAG: NTP transferase domain-containing protein [Clostridiales bacterium]|nr:NTP transferase domain-containing protein [Clostridiales bacterium]
MRLKGLIAAAGRSSRMGAFKPLLELNGFPMICMTVQSLRNGGIEDITVVIGREAERMRAVLEPLGVKLVENRDYASTDMLASVKLGLGQVMDSDGIFFLPGDIPLISPDSMARMKKRMENCSGTVQVLQPVVGSRQAHPPLLLREGYEAVLRYGKEGGLKSAFASMNTEQVLLEDEGALADADYRTDFEQLQDMAKRYRGISRKICMELYREAELPEHIQKHCLAVGELAGEMAQKLVEHGACLDTELCRSGGYVHDLCRLSPHHEEAAGRFLRERGYMALAGIAEVHRGFEAAPETVCSEPVIVCLADKLVQEAERVPLELRYQKALEKQPVKERILRDIRICRGLMREYEVITGERL